MPLPEATGSGGLNEPSRNLTRCKPSLKPDAVAGPHNASSIKSTVGRTERFREISLLNGQSGQQS